MNFRLLQAGKKRSGGAWRAAVGLKQNGTVCGLYQLGFQLRDRGWQVRVQHEYVYQISLQMVADGVWQAAGLNPNAGSNPRWLSFQTAWVALSAEHGFVHADHLFFRWLRDCRE